MLYDVALTLTAKVGPKNIKKLLDAFGTAGNIFSAGYDALRSAGLSHGPAKEIAGGVHLARGEEIIDSCRQQGIRILTAQMPEFPRNFTECADSPHVLYVRGNVDFNRGNWVSVVGTRKATDDGVVNCQRVVRDLALSFPEVVIVSGLAFGIDKTAHLAALKNGVTTVAVMAGWVDDIVPKSHYYLARQILENNGAIISEMPPGTVIERGNFLCRNRLIAGISEATIVVESASRGGSLVTADIAGSYHKEVFALPGRFGDTVAEGTNMLIRTQKAVMYQSVRDITDMLGWSVDTVEKKPVFLGERLTKFYELIPAGKRLDLEELASLWNEPLHSGSSIAGQLRAAGLLAVDAYKMYYKV